MWGIVICPVDYLNTVSYFDVRKCRDSNKKYQPSGAGGTRSRPATPHHLQHLIAHLIQNGWWGQEIGQTLGFCVLPSTLSK